MTLERVVKFAIIPRTHEGITSLIDAIYKFSQEITPPPELNRLEGVARKLGFVVRIDRRRRAVTLSRLVEG